MKSKNYKITIEKWLPVDGFQNKILRIDITAKNDERLNLFFCVDIKDFRNLTKAELERRAKRKIGEFLETSNARITDYPHHFRYFFDEKEFKER